MDKIKFLNHSTDIKVQVTGQNLEELFSNACLAAMTYMYPKNVDITTPETHQEIQLSSSGLIDLLADWLNDVIEISDKKDVCFNEYSFKKITPRELKVVIHGHRSNQKNAIKQINKDKISIGKAGDKYIAEINFDI